MQKKIVPDALAQIRTGQDLIACQSQDAGSRTQLPERLFPATGLDKGMGMQLKPRVTPHSKKRMNAGDVVADRARIRGNAGLQLADRMDAQTPGIGRVSGQQWTVGDKIGNGG